MYSNKSNEELIELLEELNQANHDLKTEVRDSAIDSRDYDRAILQLETVAEKSFYAGFECGINKEIVMTKMKAWLNYKMEARI